MNTRQRSLLIALTESAATGGELFGTGAVSTDKTERTAIVETVGDSIASLPTVPIETSDKGGGSGAHERILSSTKPRLRSRKEHQTAASATGSTEIVPFESDPTDGTTVNEAN